MVEPADLAGSNPLLREFVSLDLGRSADEATVDRLTITYAFAIPTDQALAAIARHSPGGVVELGAGTGYWASLLAANDVDVVANDRAPAQSADNKWFHSSDEWFPVQAADETVVDRHADRTLLIVWPTRDETWPGDALERFHTAGGRTVIYVGDAPGGPTGDDRFHRLLGDLDHCVACDYGVLDRPCVCDVPTHWAKVAHVALPHWPGRHDDLLVYRRLAG